MDENLGALGRDHVVERIRDWVLHGRHPKGAGRGLFRNGRKFWEIVGGGVVGLRGGGTLKVFRASCSGYFLRVDR